MLNERYAPNCKEHDSDNPSYMYSRQLGSRVSTILSPPVQVIETLALEDTDIKSEHIAQIKELIQEDIIA